MEKFIPREKLSKKSRRALDREQRKTWAINPVSRRAKNPKAYVREHPRYRLDDSGTGDVFGCSPPAPGLNIVVCAFWETVAPIGKGTADIC